MNTANVNNAPFLSADTPKEESHRNPNASAPALDSKVMQAPALAHRNLSDNPEHQKEDDSIQKGTENLCIPESLMLNPENWESIKKVSKMLESAFQQMQPDTEFTTNQDEMEEYICSNYMQNLQQTAASSSSINWNALTCEFGAFRTITPEELSDGIKYLPSRYVAILDKLERNCIGEQLTAQRSQLEKIYQTAKNGMIENYTKLLQDNLELSDSDTQQVKDSFLTILEAEVSFYRGMIAQVQAIASQTDTDNECLKNCDTYIAEQLRTGMDDIVTQTKSNAAYSVQDLIIAGQIAQKYQTETSNVPNSNTDMQTESIEHEGVISQNMAKLLQNSRVSRQKTALSTLNQKLAK